MEIVVPWKVGVGAITLKGQEGESLLVTSDDNIGDYREQVITFKTTKGTPEQVKKLLVKQNKAELFDFTINIRDFNDFIEEKFNNSYVVATMLIVVGVLFIVIENRHKGRKPQITKISQMGVPVLIWIGVFQMLAMIPGTSRSGATIVGALALGVSRTAAADFTFFLAIPAMAGASLVKLRHFGFDFTGTELGLLLLGCVVSFVVSILAIKFLLKYIQNHDFKAFGYYRIVLGIIVFLYFGIHALLA